jgi:hypothetical protein
MILEVNGKPFKVKDSDVQGVYSWDEAMAFEGEWRLPTRGELHSMHEHQKALRLIPAIGYWSSEECDDPASAWRHEFEENDHYGCSKHVPGLVRLVRDVEPVLEKTDKVKGDNKMNKEWTCTCGQKNDKQFHFCPYCGRSSWLAVERYPAEIWASPGARWLVPEQGQWKKHPSEAATHYIRADLVTSWMRGGGIMYKAGAARGMRYADC